MPAFFLRTQHAGAAGPELPRRTMSCACAGKRPAPPPLVLYKASSFSSRETSFSCSLQGSEVRASVSRAVGGRWRWSRALPRRKLRRSRRNRSIGRKRARCCCVFSPPITAATTEWTNSPAETYRPANCRSTLDPKRPGYRVKEIGSTMSGRKGTDDSMTLQSQKFQIGDYLDIAITPPNRAPPPSGRMRPY
ncbi:histone deacetylase complex subunit SAP18 isoform X3 [Acinonyx jubatus]|uniref:18 kDa Sin3-associated polypeptide n=2 Tax=Felinae TaxID=338152 RepID=A0ABI7Z2J1_FELCA|nr:histone deacetylase complex subunit SAP18 isoform X3 [Acinonyx jubatus]